MKYNNDAREEKSKENKKRIIECALKLINEKGFNNVSVSEITKTANVSKGAFYIHFKSKEDLIEQQINIFYNDFILDESKSKKQRLEYFIIESMKHIKDAGLKMCQEWFSHSVKSSFYGKSKLAYDLKNINESEFKLAIEKIKKLEGKLFSKKMVDTLVNSFTYNEIKILQTEGVIPYLKRNLKSDIRDYDEKEIKNLCLFFAKIIDYKSSTTKNHSLGVADKCMKMAKFYGFSDDKALRFYFAGAFHDIGKLIINNDILEKPGKLTTAEFENIKNHAKATERILSQIEGIEDIARWAGRHHEKLDGSGYNQSLSAKDLSFEDRLLACIDIYQALTEKRSYKDKFIHDDSINIMMDMANDNKIDINIVKDIAKCFGKEEEK